MPALLYVVAAVVWVAVGVSLVWFEDHRAALRKRKTLKAYVNLAVGALPYIGALAVPATGVYLLVESLIKVM